MSKSNPYAAKKLRNVSVVEEVIEAPSNEVPTGSITVILTWVAGDSERAIRAYEEETKSNKPRVSLLAQLEELV